MRDSPINWAKKQPEQGWEQAGKGGLFAAEYLLDGTTRVVTAKQLKSILERVGFASSLTLLGTYFVLEAAAFILAARDDRIPMTWWDRGGNHGPWRYYQPMRSLLSYASMVLISAMFIGGFTGGFLGRTRGGIVMLISLAVLILDFAFLFWLTD